MDPLSIVAVLASAALAGILILGVMASRMDNTQRFVDLVRDTRRLRASCQATNPPRGRRRA
jgi:hypothetical protein